jgi:hypothetical protein
MSFDTVFWSAPGPCVFATRVAQVEFWREVASDLELVGGVASGE